MRGSLTKQDDDSEVAFNGVIGQSSTSASAKFHSLGATPRPVCTRPHLGFLPATSPTRVKPRVTVDFLLGSPHDHSVQSPHTRREALPDTVN